MPRLRVTAEQILAKLREAEVALKDSPRLTSAVRYSITEQTYYCWRNEYGGLEVDQIKRPKDLERENTHLKRAVADPLPRNAGHPEMLHA